MLKILAIAALLLGAPAAYSQTVSSCPTATPGTAWAKGTWLPCSTTVVYIAEPVPPTAPVSDMRCTATGCVFSWQLGPKVLPTDQVWVKTTAKPKGTWDSASRLTFASTAQQCTTLVYQGAPITTVTSNLPNPGAWYQMTVPLIGVVSLGGGNMYQPVTQGNFDFSATYQGLVFPGGGSFPNNGPPTFTFTTDGTGKIVTWNLQIGAARQGGEGSSFYASSTQDGDTLTYADNEASENDPNGVTVTGTNTTPGTWTCLTDLLAQLASEQK